MDYTLLRDVNTSSQNWTIKVRAVRLCDVMKFQDAQQRQKIDFIVLDEQGTSMEAQVQDIWVKRSKTKLEEGHVYKMKYFCVMKAKPTYRLVRHTYMIQLTAFTTIEEISTIPANFPMYAHHSAPFAELEARINNDEFTSDVIGIITGCSHVRQQQTKSNTQMSLRTLLITDGSETIPVSLWGQHAEKFDADGCVEAAREKSVVILLCALTCRKFNDKLALNSSMLCRWYINPQLGEAEALRQSMPPQPIQWLFGAQNNNNNDEATNVNELAAHKNPHIIYGKKFVVSARIREINTDEMWWYLACNNCSKRMYDNGNSFKCSNSGCSTTTGKARYLLHVRAVDPVLPLADSNAPVIGLIFFGPAAEQVVGYPVEALIEKQGQVTTSVPKELKAACGKAFTLRVSVGNLSYQHGIPTYQVLTIISNIHSHPDKIGGIENEKEPAETLEEATSLGKNEPTLAQLQKELKATAPSTPAGQEITLSRKRSPETADTTPTEKISASHPSQATPVPEDQGIAEHNTEEPKTHRRQRTSAKKKLDFEDKKPDARGTDEDAHTKQWTASASNLHQHVV